ncbi:MAG: hypothetical protein IJ570_05525 [Prevotella sp.]|nr:hypothetical protein [Prevotella sp.]
MKHLLVFLLLLCAASVSAQDVIIKKDGSTIVCRVVELTDTEITYKKWSDLNGSNYVMERSAASAINYEDGRKVSLSEVTNLYTPHNQNDGTQQYNDKALLKLDYVTGNPYKKAKKLKTVGWIGGGVCVLGGAFMIAASQNGAIHHNNLLIAGISTMAAGGVLGTYCYISAHKIKKDYDTLNYSLLHEDFKFSNGSSLSAGIDMLRDNTLGQNTLGLGLRYNF